MSALPQRIEDRIEMVTESGCWIWTGTYTGTGYGQTRLNGKRCRAHRAVYSLLVGPIPEGLNLDHLCRVRKCVNPYHLEVVTQSVNVQRGEGIAGRNQRKTHCKNGHEFTVSNTMKNGNGRRCKTCTSLWEANKRRAT